MPEPIYGINNRNLATFEVNIAYDSIARSKGTRALHRDQRHRIRTVADVQRNG